MLTVVLVARDAADSLDDVLSAYARLERPHGGFRVVLVDNASVDGTAEVVRAHEDRLPLTTLYEPRRGQNRARNLAMPHVEGDLLVLTDADAIPRADWLVRLREAADRHPSHDVFAGTVRPVFATPPPPWLLAAGRHGPNFARLERDEDGDLHPREALGPNFAVRTRVLAHAPRFDESIGPDGTSDYAMGAETAFLQRLADAGVRARYVRDAVVEHRLPAALSTPEGVLVRAHRFGRGRFRLGTVPAARDGLRVGGVPLRLFADRLGRRLALLRAGRDPVRAFRARWHLAFLAGQIAEARAARRAAPAKAGAPPPTAPRLVRTPEPAEVAATASPAR